jgi:hypothetical protein
VVGKNPGGLKFRLEGHGISDGTSGHF